MCLIWSRDLISGINTSQQPQQMLFHGFDLPQIVEANVKYDRFLACNGTWLGERNDLREK